MNRTQNIIFGLLTCGVVLLVALGAGELFFRLRPDLLQSPSEAYLLDRGQEFYRFSGTTDAHGRTQNDKEAIRIAVIGDSFTQGMGVEPYDCFAYRMQSWLNNDPQNRPVEIDLLARPGWSTYRQVELLEKALAAGADAVVLVMCLNDTEDWGRPRELLDQINEILPAPPQGLWLGLTTHSYLMRWVYLGLETRLSRPRFMNYYERLYSPTYSGWRKFDAAARSFRELCRRQNVPLAVVLFPLLSHDLQEGHYPFGFCHRALRRVWSREQVPVLDLYEAFKNMRPDRLQAVPGLDPHPSEIAHRIAAKRIIAFLTSSGMLPAEYHTPEMFKHLQHRYWQHIKWRMNLFGPPEEQRDNNQGVAPQDEGAPAEGRNPGGAGEGG